MHVLFDALGSTAKSGGMRLHSTELILAWAEAYPADTLHVLGGAWWRHELRNSGVQVVQWPNENVLGRSVGQIFASAAIAYRVHADCVISLSPIVSPLLLKRRSMCFQHDWRHKKNPREFPLHQRLYRKLWEISAAHADLNVCISQKAEAETLANVPSATTVVVENGRDHGRRWPSAALDSTPPHILTYGHHNNKRPELVIQAFASVLSSLPSELQLIVLGARGTYREQLRDLGVDLGVADRVSLPGFVADEQYQKLVATSAMIALVSSDEGFGLPIAEAEYFGIPAVVTSDSGMDQIFGDYPFVAEPTSESVAAALIAGLKTRPRDSGLSGNRPATWDETARRVRQLASLPLSDD